MNKTSLTWKEFVAYIESPEHYAAIDDGLILDACYYNSRANRVEINWTENHLLFEFCFHQLGQKEDYLKVVDGERVELISDSGEKFIFRFLKAVKL